MRRQDEKLAGAPPAATKLPLWCRALIAVAAILVPRARRNDWKREWTSELAHFRSTGAALPRRGGSGVVPGARRRRQGLLARSLACFSDAAQLRKLETERIRNAGAAGHVGFGGSRWAGIDLSRSMRRAVRNLVRNPGFSVAAIVTLALGIGANTAMFSLVNAVLLKPLAVEDPQSLVRIYNSTPEGEPYGTASYPELKGVQDLDEVFDGVLGFGLAVAGLSEGGQVDSLIGEVVTGNYFDVLGVRPALGRAFLAEEDETPGTHAVVVLGHGFWTRRFAADPSIIGSTIRLNGTPFDVIGVAPAEYRGLIPGFSMDFWVPAMMIGAVMPDVPDALTGRHSRQFMMHGRLREGVGIEQAQSSVALLAGRLEASFPESNEGHEFTVLGADAVRLHPRIDRVLLPVAALLLTVVGLVLLIACTNLAGLLLARMSDRRKEIAVRLALGAGRRHIVGQLLGESVLLSLLGGAAGMLLATWLVNLIMGFRPPMLSFFTLDLGIDHRVLGFTFGLALASGLLFGIAPALQVSKPDLSRSLKDGDGVAWRARRFSLRNALIVGQVAVSMLLLLVAGLFVRSLQSAQTIDPGFDTEDSVVFTMNAALRYDEAGGREYFGKLVERVSAMPGARSVALTDRLPLGLWQQTMNIVVGDDGVSSRAGGPAGADGIEQIDFARIGPNYFRTLDVTLLAGRDFGPADGEDAARVAIVSETTTERLWPGEPAVGKFLRTQGGNTIEVVGVARDTRVRSIGEAPRPYIYLPYQQRYESTMELVIATDRDPAVFLAEARDVIMQVDPEVAPLEFMTMSEGNAIILFPIRMAAGLVGAFGLLALLLSSIGVAGSLAYAVARRSHEVGVRMALGASPGNLVRMVVIGGLKLVGLGMAVGLGLALLTTRLLEQYLVGVSPTDPVAFVVISALLAGVAGVASYIPARRAAAADPLTVLRKE